MVSAEFLAFDRGITRKL